MNSGLLTMPTENRPDQSSKRTPRVAKIYPEQLDQLVILSQRRGMSIADYFEELCGDLIAAEYELEVGRMQNELKKPKKKS